MSLTFRPQTRLQAARLNNALEHAAARGATYSPADGFDRPATAKIGEIEVSVADFMTVGETDIGVGLRRARDAGALGDGRVLVIPAGRDWTISSIDPVGAGYALRLDGYDNFTIRGKGQHATKVTAANGTDMALFNLVNVSNAVFSDFTFDNNRANQVIPNPTRPNKHSLRGGYLYGVTFDRLSIINGNGYGIGFQTGEFQDILIEDVYIEGCGLDGFDFKNPLASNRNIRINRVTVIDFGRGDPSVAKAGIDIRGPARVSNCYVKLSTATGNATNHAFYRARPDDTGSITYDNASALPIEGDVVTGGSSGATAVVNAVSGSATLATGGIGLRDIVGTFTATEALTLSGGKTATCRSFSAPVNNGGGGAVFENCIAQGPTDGVSGVGFVVVDADVTLASPRATDLRTGISANVGGPGADGGVRAQVVNPTVQRVEIGIDCRVTGTRIYGGTVTDATETGVDFVAATNGAMYGTQFVDCARAARRDVPSLNTRAIDLMFDNCPIETVNFDLGDQRSTLPHVSTRPGSCYSILPSASYATATALVGGAGGAANSTIYFCPIPIFDRVSILRLGLVIGTATASTLGKLALYRDLGGTPSNGTTANLLGECTGTVDFNSTANTQVRVSFATALKLDPGIYWAALVCNGGARPYTVPVTGAMGEWARFVGINNAASLFGGTGGQCRVSSTALVDYSAAFPAICPAVDFATTSPGSPWIGAWEG